MTVILGINAFHPDASACLVVDGILISAIAEERLGERKKHAGGFPVHAIQRLIFDVGLDLASLTHIAIARDTRANLRAKAIYAACHLRTSIPAAYENLRRTRETSSFIQQIAAIFDEDPSLSRYEIVYVEHHLAHIASAYYLSPFDGIAGGFSYDGSGDFTSMMAARCEGNDIQVLDRVLLPDSLGFFYSAICQFIGFDQFGEEYKVMGLAPYGQDNYSDVMRRLVSLPENSWFHLDRGSFGMPKGGKVDDYLQANLQLYTRKMIGYFGKPRHRESPLSKREKDLAKSAQVRFEEAAIHCLHRLHGLVPSEHLAMAGGCSLNGVTNARILKDTMFSSQFIQPAASDDGLALGAAYWVWHNVVKGKSRFHMQHAYWGPEYSHASIHSVVKSSPYGFAHYVDRQCLVQCVAQHIADGKVVGWYQGRSEWGPRALGNRSILANPLIPTMKDTINTKIKRRESFRPFAPSVLEELVPEYFEQTVSSPFMMHVVKLRKHWQDRLLAVTHVDGTGRLQSVSYSINPLYYDLISAFRRITGVGIVLNTSFNENEPIVDTPEQAYDCFARTDMDVLCMGSYVLIKG